MRISLRENQVNVLSGISEYTHTHYKATKGSAGNLGLRSRIGASTLRLLVDKKSALSLTTRDDNVQLTGVFQMGSYHTKQILTKIGVFPGDTTPVADLRSLVQALRVTAIKKDMIRIGPDKDGGYLLPDDLDGVLHCFSPGVADCSDFELDMVNRGMLAFLADRSVDGPAVEDPRFRFIKKFIASIDDPAEGLITLDTWYREELGPLSDNSPDAILQMDIEGCEYEVIHNMSELLLKKFRVLVIEFHKLHQLTDEYSFKWMSQAFFKLLRTHAVVHLHPNNNRRAISYGGLEIPSTMEFTFLRRDRIQPANHIPVFPNQLDRKTVETKPDLVLPTCWYAER
jgi:hypothetical protein